jgi:hypothetical protein
MASVAMAMERMERTTTCAETLAEIVETTRSCISFFVNRFRKLGYIDYNGCIQVHKSLLNVVLLDQLPKHNSEKLRIASVA